MILDSNRWLKVKKMNYYGLLDMETLPYGFFDDNDTRITD